MAKRGKRVGKSMPPRALSEESNDNTIWWWVGGGVVAVLGIRLGLLLLFHIVDDQLGQVIDHDLFLLLLGL